MGRHRKPSMSAASVRVCARFRPPNKMEMSRGEGEIVVRFEDSRTQVLIANGPARAPFEFDRVFHPDSTQEEVFQYTGQLLVEQCLEGFNVTMFAYGQTGSGKTWTMEGIAEMPGVIPRMVDLLFDLILDYPDEKEFLIRISYVEIYNEKLRDLLEPRNGKLRIREHKDKGVYIEGSEQIYVQGPDEVLELMAHGHLSRSVTATAMNAGSSRSHAVFMLQVEQRDSVTDSKKMSKIMMVDLAGSEKVRKTGAEGQLLKEAQNINRSLTCLGMVINRLTEGKASHIPYRDSKLTRLLSDSLGGNSKTCIVVAASPCIFNVEETISTLRFGQRCKNVKNKPKVNEELSIREYKKMCQKMEAKIAKLKGKNETLQTQNEALRELLQHDGDGELDIDDFLNNLDDVSEASEMWGDPGTPRHRSASSNTSIGSHFSPSRLAGNATLANLASKLRVLEERNVNFQDQIADLRNELVSTESERDEYREAMENFKITSQRQTDEISRLKNLEEQLKFYRLKVDCMANEHKSEIDNLTKRLEKARRPRESISMTMAQLEDVDNASARAFADLAKSMETDHDDEFGDIPEEIYEKIQLKEQRKWENTVSKLKRAVEILESREQERQHVESFENMSGSDQRAQIQQLVHDNSKLEQKQKIMLKELRHWNEKMKAVEVRQQYNDKLRRNWQAQLQQMEQALLLSNQINNQTRTKFNETIRQKDMEIAKLQKYVTSILQKQRAMKTTKNRVAKPVNRRPAGNRREQMRRSDHQPVE